MYSRLQVVMFVHVYACISKEIVVSHGSDLAKQSFFMKLEKEKRKPLIFVNSEKTEAQQ